MRLFIPSAIALLTAAVSIRAQGGPQDPFYGVPFHPLNTTTKCLDVRGGVLANGTPVQIYDCNGSEAQRWIYNWNQDFSLRLAHTNFCVDAGSNFLPQPNGNQLKIWDCYPSLVQQQWFIGANNTVKLFEVQHGPFGICMDLTEGSFENSNVIQTWECSANNANQLWTLGVRAPAQV
ncbi:19 kDa protein having G-X-X-X-Q-X-W motif-containing protein [Coprinopsis sp. MPI-PUGE-AT-0042]|nr:19 kDa protein having G-X-X-X-Q-X-W motif-containing protein [Coprinopsis sp. MPI-PUGE-AT-0042]